jgi:hypothetical protein
MGRDRRCAASSGRGTSAATPHPDGFAVFPSPLRGREERSVFAAVALLILFASPAAAADIVSSAPQAVAVTIYRDRPMNTPELAQLGDADTDGLALVSEDRDVDLPAGRSRLRFEGVADGIIPQSAGVEGLPVPPAERDFDYNLLTPGALVAASLGQDVELVRTDRKTGRETRQSAVIRSGPDGVVLEVGGRFEALGCGGEAEKLVFDRVPDGLSPRPTLSLAVDAPHAGHYRVRLSYLTVRMDWTADYIARVAPDGRSLALTGWITLANRTATAFDNAPTEVVAGHLARVPVEIPQPQTPVSNPQCWPVQTTSSGWLTPSPQVAGVPMVARSFALAAPPAPVAARKLAIESQLGDYKLYTLPEPTTVAARQTKQVLFLDQPAVKFDTVYAYTVQQSDDAPVDLTPQPARIVMRLDNTAAQGLGRPLPEGSIQLRQAPAAAYGRESLIGEPDLDRDVPVGEPFELRLGQAPDVMVAERVTSDQRSAADRVRRAFEVVAANAKAVPAVVEIRHDRAGETGFKVVAESVPHGDKSGDPLWRLTVPAGGARTLSYAVEYLPD